MSEVAADSGMKNIIALIPNVGSGEAACAEERSHDVLFCRNLRMGDVKQHNTHKERERERERERGTKRYISIIKICNSYK